MSLKRRILWWTVTFVYILFLVVFLIILPFILIPGLASLSENWFGSTNAAELAFLTVLIIGTVFFVLLYVWSNNLYHKISYCLEK
jgi:TRAP-type mannitol/chloroaromatic compound transport system permease small subunit